MGILSSAWSFITSGTEQATKITDAVINTGDMLVYTDEEKAIDKAEDYIKRRDAWLKMMELARDENSIKSITRRIFVLIIVIHFFIFLDIFVAAGVAGLYFELPVMKDISKMLWDIIELLFPMVAGAGVFYFGVDWVRRK